MSMALLIGPSAPQWCLCWIVPYVHHDHPRPFIGRAALPPMRLEDALLWAQRARKECPWRAYWLEAGQ